MNKVILLLGGNQGHRFELLNRALILIDNNIGIIINESTVYESEPWGFIDENDFLNKVVVVQTNKSADEVLSSIHHIENQCGRKRYGGHWESRTMDIDILFFNNEIIKTERLIIPHEQIQNRKFTLIPIVEILPDFIHPKSQNSMSELLEECKDKSIVNKVDSERIPI